MSAIDLLLRNILTDPESREEAFFRLLQAATIPFGVALAATLGARTLASLASSSTALPPVWDIDVDLPLPTLKERKKSSAVKSAGGDEEEKTDENNDWWERTMLYDVALGALPVIGAVGGLAAGRRLYQLMRTAVLHRRLQKTLKYYQDALKLQLLAAQISRQEDPFAPYKKTKAGSEKQAQDEKLSVWDFITNFWPLYFAYAGSVAPIAAYLAFKEVASKDPQRALFAKAYAEYQKRLGVSPPFVQLAEEYVPASYQDPKALQRAIKRLERRLRRFK